MDVFENPEKYIEARKSGGPPDLKLKKTPAQKKRAALAAQQQQEEEETAREEQVGPPSMDEEEDEELTDPQEPVYQQPVYQQQYQQPPMQPQPVQPQYQPQPQPETPPCYNEVAAFNSLNGYFKKYLEYHRKLLKYQEGLLQESIDFENERRKTPPEQTSISAKVKTMADDPGVIEATSKKAKNMKILFIMVGAILMMGSMYIVTSLLEMPPALALAIIVAAIGGAVMSGGIR